MVLEVENSVSAATNAEGTGLGPCCRSVAEAQRQSTQTSSIGSHPATVERYLKQISPVITTAIREFELTMNNPFVGVVIPNKAEGQRKPRGSFSQDELRAIQQRLPREEQSTAQGYRNAFRHWSPSGRDHRSS